MAWSMQSHIFYNMILYQGRRGQLLLVIQYHVQYTYLVVHIHHRGTYVRIVLMYHLHNHRVASFSGVVLGLNI